jgi:hypothetical protein
MNLFGFEEPEKKELTPNEFKEKRANVLKQWNDAYFNEYSLSPTDYKTKLEIACKAAVKLIDELYEAYNAKPELSPQPTAKEVETTNPGFAKLLKKLEQDHEESDRAAYDNMLLRRVQR